MPESRPESRPVPRAGTTYGVVKPGLLGLKEISIWQLLVCLTQTPSSPTSAAQSRPVPPSPAQSSESKPATGHPPRPARRALAKIYIYTPPLDGFEGIARWYDPSDSHEAIINFFAGAAHPPPHPPPLGGGRRVLLLPGSYTYPGPYTYSYPGPYTYSYPGGSADRAGGAPPPPPPGNAQVS